MMFRYSTISLTVKLPDASELRSARSKRAVFGTSLSWLHITMHQVHQSFFIGPMLLGQNSENIRDEEITKHWAALARYKILGFAKVYLFCSVCIRLIIRRCCAGRHGPLCTKPQLKSLGGATFMFLQGCDGKVWEGEIFSMQKTALGF